MNFLRAHWVTILPFLGGGVAGGFNIYYQQQNLIIERKRLEFQRDQLAQQNQQNQLIQNHLTQQNQLIQNQLIQQNQQNQEIQNQLAQQNQENQLIQEQLGMLNIFLEQNENNFNEYNAVYVDNDVVNLVGINNNDGEDNV